MVQIVGRPCQPETPNEEPEPAEEAGNRLREREKSEARIAITTSDAGQKSKPTIAFLIINCGNDLHITRKGMCYDMTST